MSSPLIWGIHTASNSTFNAIEDLRGRRAAISRFGSGSHLMAYVNAENQGWDIASDLKFEVIKNLVGAVEGLTNGKADYFMWEKFTTKPLVDNGTFNCVGDCPTPWPCFVIAATNEFIENRSDELEIILNIINQNTSGFKNIPDIDITLSKRYGQKIEDVREWLNLTEWSQQQISEDQISDVQHKLLALNLITEALPYHKICMH